MWKRGKFSLLVILIEIAFIIVYGCVVVYDPDANASNPSHSISESLNGSNYRENMLEDYYPLFQDVSVMIFIGFGFLMTFLKKYGYSAVGLNMLLACIAVQWGIIMQNVWHTHHGKLYINVYSLINAEFGSATVLISYGALLGKLSPIQLVVMCMIEITIFGCNEHLGVGIYKTADIGGSIFLHTFGAYFGLAVTFVLYRKEFREHPKEGAVYHSDIFAMIGTIYLWLFWPSFNSALGLGDDRHRAVINTYLSLSSCVLISFATSSLVDGKNRFNMVHVQNATIAGGVAIGTTANMMTHPYGAMIIGGLAGFISVMGYHFLTPFLAKYCRIHDTCGVNNLHGMPGIYAALVSAIVVSLASEDNYGYSLYEIFGYMSPAANSSKLAEIQSQFQEIDPGKGRTASLQAGFQLIALVTTLAVSIGGGLVTGFILKLPFLDSPNYDQLYEDGEFWEVPEEEEHEVQPYFNRKDDDTKV
ncbi:ammonium transporter Rh type A-like isoform X2 [Tachypleus tridentatus]|uniref:ammonium transporter Rh type A-like isoform X2 n=1 Tax=Tachypleus tridentatus TaxID=6853 RepID=UPI003FD346D5